MMSKDSLIDSFFVQRLNLLKTIKVMTILLGGEAYLNFCGNEFNHPEWVEFPSKENKWSHSKCRRQWSLAKDSNLFYSSLQNFETNLIELTLMANRDVVPTRLKHLEEIDSLLVIQSRTLLVYLNMSVISTYFNPPQALDIAMETNSPEYGPFERPIGGCSDSSLSFFAGFSSKIYFLK